MEPLITPSVTEQDLETLPIWVRELLQTQRLNCEMWQTVAKQQKAENANLLTQDMERKIEIERLQTRIDQLEKELRQNSNNSSKPPSSDPLYKARKLLLTVRSKKKPGGQPGHERQEQKILPTKDVREVIPKVCEHCQTPLLGKDPQPKLHQNIEIPPVQPIVTHFRVHQLKCRWCGVTIRGEVPAVMRSSYGTR